MLAGLSSIIDPSLAGSTLRYLLDLTLKGCILLGVAGGMTFFLRRGSAAMRHLVLTMALSGMLCLPVLSTLLPSWHWSLLIPPSLVEAPLVEAPSHMAPASPALVPPQSPVAPSPPQVRVRRLEEAVSSAPEKDLIASPGRVTTPPQEPVVAEVRARTGSNGVPVARLLSLLWGLGTLFFLTRMGIGSLGIRRLAHRGVPIRDPAWLELVDELARRLALHRRITLLRTGEATMPVTWGGYHPTILLPACAETWTVDRLRCVLLHEMAHIKRWDCLTQSLARLAHAVYWYNPLMWVLVRRLRMEREKASDDCVLAEGIPPSRYAAHLLALARSLHPARGTGLAAVPMVRPSQLESRLHAILDPHRPHVRLDRRRALGVGLAAVMMVAPLAAVSPWQGPQAAPVPAGGDAPVVDETPAAGGGHTVFAAEQTSTARRTMLVRARLRRPELLEAAGSTGRPRLRMPEGLNVKMTAGDREVRRGAVRALGPNTAAGAPAGLEMPVFREALATMISVEVETMMTEAMAQATRKAREAVEQAFVTWVGPGRARIQDMPGAVRRGKKSPAARADGQTLTNLLEGLYAGEQAEKGAIICALAALGNARAVPALSRILLADDDPELRRKAAWALGEIGDARAVKSLYSARHDASPDVRRAAALALDEIDE